MWLAIVLYAILITNIRGQTDMTLYSKLPPLYTLQNYDSCMLSGPAEGTSTYCFVFAEVQPDHHNNVWSNIERFSNDTQHRYRHDYIYFGLCVEQCKEMLKNSTYDFGEINPEIPDNTIIDYYKRVYANDLRDEQTVVHHKLLHQCVNLEFQRSYNLTLKTFVEYCNTPSKEFKPGYLEIVAYSIIAFLVLSNILSSLYDCYLKSQQVSAKLESSDYYSEEVKGLGSSILTSFSICRNYRKIIAPNKDTEFDFTYFYRFFTACLVILGHLTIVGSGVPVKNPEFFENCTYKVINTLFQNATSLWQIFFVLAGFMLKLKFDQLKVITTQSSCRKTITVFFLGFIRRYLRLLPTLALLIFFSATLLTRLGSGPTWRHLTDGEIAFCTQYWWKHIFMINNYMVDDTCVHQTWFLAADMQLFTLYLMVVIVTAKFKRVKTPLYILLAIIAFAAPGLLTYIYGMGGNIYLKPEDYRYFYFQNPKEMHISYTGFHCNFGGYLMGIIFAEIYQSKRFQKMKADFSKYARSLAVQIPFLVFIHIIGFGLLFSGLLVMDHKTGESSIWTAIYAACNRNLWAISGGFCILAMSMKFGWLGYDLCSLGIFRFLGRITFQMYLWNYTIVRLLLGNSHHLWQFSGSLSAYHTAISFILTIVVGFIMTLFVEFPLGNIINSLFKKATESVGKNN